jgi:hypothetical protein
MIGATKFDAAHPDSSSDSGERHGLLSSGPREGSDDTQRQNRRKAPPSPGRQWSEQEFVTVDWVHDVEVARHHRELAQKMKIFGSFIAMYDAVQGWLCLAIVGVATGLAAGMIDFGVVRHFAAILLRFSSQIFISMVAVLH